MAEELTAIPQPVALIILETAHPQVVDVAVRCSINGNSDTEVVVQVLTMVGQTGVDKPQQRQVGEDMRVGIINSEEEYAVRIVRIMYIVIQ